MSLSSMAGRRRRTVLVIDDEPDLRELVAMTLERLDIDTHAAANLAEARHLLERHEFDACLTDMRLPDGDGVAFVAELAAARPSLPVAVITAHGQMKSAVEAMKHGAFDFVSKPVDLALLRRLVAQAMGSRGGVPTTTASDDRPASAPIDTVAGHASDATNDTPLIDGHLLVGDSPPMRELRDMIAKVARTNAPIWITGESGTGKELIAKLIHRNGARANGPFIAVNCGAIPGELMESEFFGHRKGSYTGAHADSPGLFRSAEGGTLFLDEIAELPLHMQVKLLRAVQERSVRTVGEVRERPVDVRILSASHVDLARAVSDGRFRQDLYYRLNVISVKAPSLRVRARDIPALVRFMIGRQAGSTEGPRPEVSDEALEMLMRHGFPGNVRELENVLERAVALSAGGRIEARDLSLGTVIEIVPSRPDRPSVTDSRMEPSADGEKTERNRIIAALEETRWNRKKAAQKLGMTYRQLRYRIRRMRLEHDDDEAA